MRGGGKEWGVGAWVRYRHTANVLAAPPGPSARSSMCLLIEVECWAARPKERAGRDQGRRSRARALSALRLASCRARWFVLSCPAVFRRSIALAAERGGLPWANGRPPVNGERAYGLVDGAENAATDGFSSQLPSAACLLSVEACLRACLPLRPCGWRGKGWKRAEDPGFQCSVRRSPKYLLFR